MRKLGLAFGLLAALHLTTAHAYIGPGAGAGVIAVVLGILSSIFLAFVGILYYPIKRLFKRRKASARKANNPRSDNGPMHDSEGADRAPPAPGDRR